jgi:hypothetical protein
MIALARSLDELPLVHGPVSVGATPIAALLGYGVEKSPSVLWSEDKDR